MGFGLFNIRNWISYDLHLNSESSKHKHPSKETKRTFEAPNKPQLLINYWVIPSALRPVIETNENHGTDCSSSLDKHIRRGIMGGKWRRFNSL